MTTPTQPTVAAVLQGLGFKADEGTKTYLEGLAESAKMHDSGPYQVREVFVHPSGITVTVEQNTAPDDLSDGMKAVISHPPCAIIDGPNGYRVAFNPADTRLAETLVNELLAANAPSKA